MNSHEVTEPARPDAVQEAPRHQHDPPQQDHQNPRPGHYPLAQQDQPQAAPREQLAPREQAAPQEQQETLPQRAPLSADPATPERFRDAVRPLDDIDQRPVADHAETYDAVHRDLRTTLDDVDRG